MNFSNLAVQSPQISSLISKQFLQHFFELFMVLLLYSYLCFLTRIVSFSIDANVSLYALDLLRLFNTNIHDLPLTKSQANIFLNEALLLISSSFNDHKLVVQINKFLVQRKRYKKVFCKILLISLPSAWKVYKYRVFSGPYFLVFGLNTGRYGPEKTPYLDTFHAVPLSLTYLLLI